MDADRMADRENVAGEASAGGERCWCGATDLEPLRPDYGCCESCGTVVFTEPYEPADYASTGPGAFYGDRYWRHHVPERLGLPGLEERARSDLPERAVFHLARILDRLAPGARVLELGCGAGSLTYLLQVAGFDAAGVELGPAAIELARRRFGVEVHRGPLERLDAAGAFDAIVAVDVLEHLPDPLATMRLCAERLAPGGLVLLQTPRYRDDGPGWEMLVPREHLFLYTGDSIERLLRAAGFDAVEVRDSFFAYDMWVAATPAPSLPRRSDPLAGVSPAAVALIDARAALEEATADRDAVDADRRLKEDAGERLGRELAEVRDDQQRKDELLRRQDGEIEPLRRDQREKQELVDRLDAELAATRRDQAARGELIDQLTADLDSARRDQAARGELIERLSADLEAARRDQAAKGELIERLSADLEAARRDQAAKSGLIERLSADLEAARRDQAAKGQLVERLSAGFEQLAADLEAVRSDHADRGELIERLSAELVEVRGDQAAKAELIGRLDGELAAATARLDALDGELRQTRGELRQIHGDRLYRWLQAARRRLGGRR